MAELPPLPPHLTDNDKLMGFRAALIRKIGEVAQELENLLAGQNGTLATMKVPGTGGTEEDPEDKLRKYLEFLRTKLKHIIDDDGLYGRCEHCMTPLSEPELKEMPWADTCRSCAAKGLG